MRNRAASLANAGLVGLLALLGTGTGVGRASVPSPGRSIIPSQIRIVGIDGAGTPDPRGEFTVEVRNIAGYPMANITVTADFAQCGEVRLCTDPHDAAAIVHCGTQTVRKETNAAGRATFRVVGGSVGVAGSPGPPGACGHFYFEGIHGGAARVAIFDLVGIDGLRPGDLSAWLTDYFGPYVPARSDFDGNGTLGPADLSMWLDAFFGGGSQLGCPTAHCP